MSGALLLVPVANPFAFAHFSRQSPDQHEQTNLWGAFPGSAKGTLTQRYAHKIREILIEGADYLVECHSGGAAGRIQRRVDTDPDTEGPLAEKSREMAIAFASGVLRWCMACLSANRALRAMRSRRRYPPSAWRLAALTCPNARRISIAATWEKGFLNLLVISG